MPRLESIAPADVRPYHVQVWRPTTRRTERCSSRQPRGVPHGIGSRYWAPARQVCAELLDGGPCGFTGPEQAGVNAARDDHWRAQLGGMTNDSEANGYERARR